MPALIGFFFRVLAWALPGLGFHLLRSLGFAAVTFVGIQPMLTWAKDYCFSRMAGLPADIIQVLGLLQIDVAFEILFSCYVARAIVGGMNGSGSKSAIRFTGK